MSYVWFIVLGMKRQLTTKEVISVKDDVFGLAQPEASLSNLDILCISKTEEPERFDAC